MNEKNKVFSRKDIFFPFNHFICLIFCDNQSPFMYVVVFSIYCIRDIFCNKKVII